MKTLPELFEDHQGCPTHKYPHHIAIYEQLFSSMRGRPIRLLEIGLGHGGSMQLWRQYFGPEATIIGVDVQDREHLQEKWGGKIITGNQGDPEFWRAVKPQLGSLDIVIDDGSHMCLHQSLTFHELFPLVADGGYYIIEDIHTSYRDGYNEGGSFIEYLKTMIDDIHGSELGNDVVARTHIFSIHFYPSLAVIHKKNPEKWGGSTMRPVVQNAN